MCVGGAAVVLSNKWFHAYKASFKLLTSVRTQYVHPESAGCVYETEDEERNHGVRLSKDIVKVAGRAMEKNFTTLGRHTGTSEYTSKLRLLIFVRRGRSGWRYSYCLYSDISHSDRSC